MGIYDWFLERGLKGDIHVQASIDPTTMIILDQIIITCLGILRSIALITQGNESLTQLNGGDPELALPASTQLASSILVESFGREKEPATDPVVAEVKSSEKDEVFVKQDESLSTLADGNDDLPVRDLAALQEAIIVKRVNLDKRLRKSCPDCDPNLSCQSIVLRNGLKGVICSTSKHLVCFTFSSGWFDS